MEMHFSKDYKFINTEQKQVFFVVTLQVWKQHSDFCFDFVEVQATTSCFCPFLNIIVAVNVHKLWCDCQC